MSPTSPTSLDLARRLLGTEAARGKGSRGGDNGADPAAQVCEKLRNILTAFAGVEGYRSLLTRALTLAKAQEPSLAAVQVLEDGSLTALQEPSDMRRAGAGKKAGLAGQVLITQLLDLLVIFIGEPLTLQLVRSAWPDVREGASNSTVEGTP